MTRVNCFVRGCKYQERFTCDKLVIEVTKGGVCASFVHIPGYERRDKGRAAS